MARKYLSKSTFIKGVEFEKGGREYFEAINKNSQKISVFATENYS